MPRRLLAFPCQRGGLEAFHAKRGRGGSVEGFDSISNSIIGAGLDVHRELGPGLFESVYENCLAHELEQRGLGVERQKVLPVHYKGLCLSQGFRLDLLVEGAVVVEIKSIEKLDRLHEAQLLSYLKLSGCSVGLLMNFNVPLLKRGIRRLVRNWHPKHEPSALSSLPRFA
jgi:GxxExxY protein